jgi:nucleotide-binding universal stress UspA family protein
MYDRILVPLDGSALSEAAVRLALLIPSRLVYLLHVEDDTPAVEHVISPSGREVRTRWLVEEEQEHLQRAAAAFRDQGREVEVLRVGGDRAQRIAEAAVDVDLIVMTTHARGPAGRAILGSVADRVAREAPAPTLLVRGDYALASPPLTRIVVPLDGSPLAGKAESVAAELASALALRVHLVRVVEPSQEETSRAAAHADLDARVARLWEQDVVATSEVRAGPVVPELRAAIRPRDLVVMTTHGRGGVRRLVLGSVAGALVRHADAPVLLLRAGMLASVDGGRKG